MNEPRISIVTINYNNADGLASTLQSVSMQDYKYIEHVVYDGVSSDHSREVIDNYGKHLSKCCIAPNGGIYFNQNRGFELSTGEYVLFLNSGDYLQHTKAISNLVASLQPATDIGYANLWLKNGEELLLKRYPELLPPDYFLYETLAHPATLIRRVWLERFGLYDESLRICSDWKFFLQAFYKPEIRFQHINSAPSVFGLDGTSSKPENRATILKEKLETIQLLFPSLEKDFRKRNDLTTGSETITPFSFSLASKCWTWVKKSIGARNA